MYIPTKINICIHRLRTWNTLRYDFCSKLSLYVYIYGKILVYNFIRMETDICGINVLIVEIVIIVSYRGNN